MLIGRGYSCVLLMGWLIAMAPVMAQEVDVTQIYLEHVEPGIESYQSRLLVTDRFLRMDDGQDQDDFILFDLQTQQIHSVNHETQLHIKLKPAPARQVEFQLDYQVTMKPLQDAPAVAGQQPTEYQFFANGQLCKLSINASDLLPRATRALAQYEQQIAERNKLSIEQVPESVKTACYLANNVLHSVDYLQGGFPLMVMDHKGRQKRLLEFSEVKKPAAIFSLPDNYRQYSPPLAQPEN